jgi:hypothetical protein
MSLSITWYPAPLMTCHTCGEQWTPKPARGQKEPTDASLKRETDKHFKECTGVKGKGDIR